MGGVRKPFHVRQRKGSGFWWYDFTTKGQRFRGPLTVRRGADRSEAEREAGARWYEEAHRQGIPAPESAAERDTRKLIVRYVAEWLPVKARKRAGRYAELEELRLTLHVLPKFPLLDRITTSAWDDAQGEMHASGLKLDTIRKVTISLRQFLRWCGKVKVLPVVPSLNAPTGEEVAAEAPERRAFSEAERDRFLAAMAKLDARAHRIYTTLLYTALRKSGLERMLPTWINWDTGFATFPASAMKKRRATSFYLHPLAREAIRAELDGRERDLAPVFGRFDYDGHNGPERTGLFWKACRLAGIPLDGLTAHHVTRHTACSIAGNNGSTLAELMALGGWESPAMAMRYFHADAKQSKGAVERL
jgi:integrase